MQLTDRIRKRALELGFTSCGFSPASGLEGASHQFLDWLRRGYAGEMDYLHRHAELRMNPDGLVPGAKTVISLSAGYDATQREPGRGMPRFSRYAGGTDYHKVLRSKGRELLRFIREISGPLNGRFFCDSAPVMERAWAQKAGLGWIGRNGCLIIPGQGSWFFLAELVIDQDMQEETPTIPDRCGNCRRCIDACPTGALLGDGTMDARKCISYLTIEHHSAIPEHFRGAWDGWIFGCDICQEVCPWNRRPSISIMKELLPDTAQAGASWDGILALTEVDFARLYGHTAVKRAGLQRLKRNAEFIRNSGQHDNRKS